MFSAQEIGAEAPGGTALQGPDGTLYFGGDVLISFDGDRWRTTSVNGAHLLRGLDFSRDGRLWGGAFGEIGWFQLSNGRSTYHSLRAKLPPQQPLLGAVWHAFAEPGGAVFLSPTTVLRWDGQQFQSWEFAGGRHLRGLRVDEEIYIQHVPTGLYVMTPAGPELVVSAQLLGDRSIFWMRRESSGWLMLTSSGLCTVRDGKLTFVGKTLGPFLQEYPATTVVALPNDQLAVGTLNNGLAIVSLQGELVTQFNEANGLKASYVEPLVVDHEGSLWASIKGTLVRFSLRSASGVLDRRAGLPLEPVIKIGAYKGELLLANGPSLYQLNPQLRQFEQLPVGLGALNDFIETPDGLLAVGYRAVSQIKPGLTRIIHSTDADVFSVAPSRRTPGASYIADGRNILELSGKNPAKLLVSQAPDAATSLAEDGNGVLWFGTNSSGIFTASLATTPVSARAAQESRGLANPRGEARVTATSDGRILAFNERGGWLQSGTGETFTRISQSPERAVSALSPSSGRDGEFWLVHGGNNQRQATVARVSVEGDHAKWEPHSVEGLPAIGSPRAIFAQHSVDRSPVLWIGGTTGVLRHELSHGASAPVPHPPVVRAYAFAANSDVPEPLTNALPHSTSSIHFELAAAQFALRPLLRLETWIDGIDPGWLPVGPTSRRELTALRDGHYIFRARLVAETGVASPAVVREFSVLPPWWRTSSAMVAGVLALIPALYGGYYWRSRSLRRRNAELEAKVKQRTEQLLQASAAKTQFVANMSHDIRNPLNGIVGLALALDDTSLDQKQREIVATLKECTTYLSSLVDDVLDFASIEAGQVELRPEPFAPAELLRSVMTTLKADSLESGALLSFEVDTRVPPNLLGDAGRIQQILVNYVSNALKYAGGPIRLSATVPAHTPDEIEFCVRDQGPGISEQDQATLFVKFSRLPNARAHDIPGSGLGLASCRVLADLMGGSVGVQSHPGMGARFFLRLPLMVSAAPVETAPLDLPNTTVLLVEDTDYNAVAATAVLGKIGLKCERARNGAEALQLFSEKRFNMVLLDRNLPDMDGTEVARRIRELETQGSHSLLLAVTAYCTADDRLRCLDAGMDAFVGKPLTPDKLRKVLLAAGRRLVPSAPLQVAGEVSPANLDLSLLGYLGDGSAEGLSLQVDRFLAILTEVEEELVKAVDRDDFSTLRITAHRLLGHAKMVGGQALEALAAEMELAAKQEDRAGCAAVLQRIHVKSRGITAALRYRRPLVETV